MAYMLNKKTSLEKDLEQTQQNITKNHKKGGFLFIFPIIISVVVFFAMKSFIGSMGNGMESETNMADYIVSFFFAIVALGISSIFITILQAILFGVSHTKDNRAILKSGIKGERQTLSILSRLPDNCVVLNDLNVITYNGRKSQIDNVVVTPNGIFVIETKNHTGYIFGDYSAKNWLQHKSRNGNNETKEFYNPTQQVSTHGERLYEYFKERGLNYNPHCMVFFANKNATVNIQGVSSIPVFSQSQGGDNAMLSYMYNHQVQYLTPKDIQIIVTHLHNM